MAFRSAWWPPAIMVTRSHKLACVDILPRAPPVPKPSYPPRACLDTPTLRAARDRHPCERIRPPLTRVLRVRRCAHASDDVHPSCSWPLARSLPRPISLERLLRATPSRPASCALLPTLRVGGLAVRCGPRASCPPSTRLQGVPRMARSRHCGSVVQTVRGARGHRRVRGRAPARSALGLENNLRLRARPSIAPRHLRPSYLRRLESGPILRLLVRVTDSLRGFGCHVSAIYCLSRFPLPLSSSHSSCGARPRKNWTRVGHYSSHGRPGACPRVLPQCASEGVRLPRRCRPLCQETRTGLGLPVPRQDVERKSVTVVPVPPRGIVDRMTPTFLSVHLAQLDVGIQVSDQAPCS